MVTFYLGSARAKRAYIKTIEGGVLLDNVEVLFCASENGRNYFAYAPVPFGGFRVGDYLRYRRALCGEKLLVSDIEKFGIKPNRKMRGLSAAERRIVQFLEKTCGQTDKPIIINLDGIRYTRRNMAALKRLISVIPEVHVFVTDKRFASRFRGEYVTKTFGSQSAFITHKFYAAKELAQRVGADKVSVM
ncbi:MAG: hypothetical protein K2M47_04340 [Clostridiales bacterium]|nr:hypothetical protein [Clostridiales bacterium]MDE6201088.1 hypothetical protein [Clostridiales bacterium]